MAERAEHARARRVGWRSRAFAGRHPPAVAHARRRRPRTARSGRGEVVGGHRQRRTADLVGHRPRRDRHQVPAVGVAGDVPAFVDPAAYDPSPSAVHRRRRIELAVHAGEATRAVAGGTGAASRRMGSVAWRESVLRDHPDLLRQRRAPPRARLHDDRRRRARRGGTGCSARTSSSSPAPTSTASRSSRRPRPRARHRRSSPTRSPRSSPRHGTASNIANDDFIRTTEPRHRRAVLELLQRCYDAGDIELDPYSGKYCVQLRGVLHRRRVARRRAVPDPPHAGRRLRGGELLLPPSRFQDRLLDWYAAHPDAIMPEHRRNEALGLIRGGLRDFSVSRTSLKWGIPLPWDPAPCRLRVVRRAHQLPGGRRLRRPRADYTDWWPVDYHLIGKDIIRHHCVYWPAMLMSAGVEPPKGWAVGGLLLVGGEKMARPAATRSTRSSSSTPSASTGSATTCSPRRRTDRTATSPSTG